MDEELRRDLLADAMRISGSSGWCPPLTRGGPEKSSPLGRTLAGEDRSAAAPLLANADPRSVRQRAFMDALRGAVDQGEASSARRHSRRAPDASVTVARSRNQDDQPFRRSIAAVRIDPAYGLYPVKPEERNDGDDPRDRAADGFPSETTTKT